MSVSAPWNASFTARTPTRAECHGKRHYPIPCPGFFELFFEGSDANLQSGLVLLGLVEESACLVQLCLVHGFDLRRLLAPSRLQLLQLVRQLAILSLQETNLLASRRPRVVAEEEEEENRAGFKGGGSPGPTPPTNRILPPNPSYFIYG